MVSFNNYKLFISTALFHAFVLSVVLSSPIPNSPYDNFIHYFIENNCSMPKDLKLPFKDQSSDASAFNYLPLNACQKPDRSKEFDPVSLLCAEIFDVLKNITCVKYNQSLSVIESDHFSEDVCHDFGSLRNILPEKHLSVRLTDDMMCKILCAEEKYDLCKILLWSYDTFMKISHASHTEKPIQKNGDETTTKVSLSKVISSLKPNLAIDKSDPNNQNSEEYDNAQVGGNGNTEEGRLPESELNEIDNDHDKNSKLSNDLAENISGAISSKKGLPDPQIQHDNNPKESNDLVGNISGNISSKEDLSNPQIHKVTDKTTNTNVADSVLQKKSESEKEKLPAEVFVNRDESKNVPSMKPQIKHTHDNENEIDDTVKTSAKKVTDPQVEDKQINLTSSESQIKAKQSTKSATASISQSNQNDNVSTKEEKVDASSKTSEKSAEPISPANGNDNELKGSNFPEEEEKPKQTNLENPVNDNELKGSNFPGEEKPKQTNLENPVNDNELKGSNFPEEEKPKQTDLENQAGKEIGKPKQSDYESPNEAAPDIDGKLPEPTQPAIPDEDIEHPEEKDPDQYNSFSLPSKNKGGAVHPLPVDSNQMPNSYGSNINSKDNINRITEEIAMIAPFPEQEDSHFFFYFLSIVLIIMAGYLIFHNKQKIIALIVEGRHERRRRSHGAGYKKLETK